MKTILSKLYISYLRLIMKTCSITFEGPDIESNSIIGFWHGDSLSMNLLLARYPHQNSNVRVVVTEDQRGDYIEKIIQYFGGKIIRLGDGARVRKGLKQLYQICEREEILCIALDGPVGPANVPKCISSKLAKQFDRPLCTIDIQYNKVISLWRRWDKYKIPLPFTKITFQISMFELV